MLRTGYTPLILLMMTLASLFLTLPLQLHAEPPTRQRPPVFQEGEIQHGFSEFDSLPVLPPTAPAQSPTDDISAIPDSVNGTDLPPEGLFYTIEFAKGFEEEEGIRRGHFVVPIDSTSTFTPETSIIYLVFRVHQHYTPYQVIGRLYPEHAEGLHPSFLMDEDAMHLATEDESGYLQFAPPEGEWPVGKYRVEVFVGFQANQLNIMGTMRFSVSRKALLP